MGLTKYCESYMNQAEALEKNGLSSISSFLSIQTLSCQNDLNQQFLFCREQEGLTGLSLYLFSRKRLCQSLGLSQFYLSSDNKPILPLQVDLFLDLNHPVLKNIKGFFQKDFKSGYLIALFHEEKEMGFPISSSYVSSK